MIKKDTMFSVRTTEELKKQFKIACIASDASISEVINKAMKDYIEEVNGGEK